MSPVSVAMRKVILKVSALEDIENPSQKPLTGRETKNRTLRRDPLREDIDRTASFSI